MARLILIEGIPGSGKTTLTAQLSSLLQRAGIPSAAWLEGQSGHPAELEWHACFSREEYAALLRSFPARTEALHARTRQEGDFTLIRYRENGAFCFSGALLARLQEREFRYALSPCIPFEAYAAVSLSHWRSLAAEWEKKPGVLLLESAFLQHPVQDMLLHYALPDETIAAFLRCAADALRPLAPVLFYLAPEDVPTTLAHIAKERGMPEMAFPDSVAFWSRRRTLELSLLPGLPLDAHIVYNSGETPAQTVHRMFELLPETLFPHK